ncbi:hypothetical protein ACCT25_37520, partial [Rhizobium ruizarguesonis]
RSCCTVVSWLATGRVAAPCSVALDWRTTGSIGERASETTGSTHYMMNPKKPLNMDCKLGFNPTSSSSCNY